jgi:hypothetical protein
MSRFLAQHPEVLDAARAWAEEKRTQGAPWVMVSDSPIKTAGYLIDHAGGVKEARACITAAARLQKRPQGKPASHDDDALFFCVLVTRAKRRCSFAAACREVAREFGINAVSNFTDRMKIRKSKLVRHLKRR